MTRRTRTYRPLLEQLERLELFAADLFASPFTDALAGPFDRPHAARPAVLAEPNALRPSHDAGQVGASAGAAAGAGAGPVVVAVAVSDGEALQIIVLAGGGDPGTQQQPEPIPDLFPIQGSVAGFVHRRGADDGEVKVEKVVTFNQFNPRGNFSTFGAGAENNRMQNLQPPQENRQVFWLPNQQQPGPLNYGPNVRFNTPEARRDPLNQGRMLAYAKADGQITGWDNRLVRWQPRGCYAAVRVGGAVVPTEAATAGYEITDPLLWEASAAERWEVSYTPNNTFNWHVPSATEAPNASSVVTMLGWIWYEPHGLPLTEWFTWGVTYYSSGQFSASFYAYPGLALDLEAINQDFRSRFSYDAGRGDFTFNGAGFRFAAEFQPRGYGYERFMSHVKTDISAYSIL